MQLYTHAGSSIRLVVTLLMFEGRNASRNVVAGGVSFDPCDTDGPRSFTEDGLLEMMPEISIGGCLPTSSARIAIYCSLYDQLGLVDEGLTVAANVDRSVT